MNRISQYLVYPIVWLCSKPFFDVEFKNPDNFKQIIGKPAIILANHIAYYDSFLLRLNPDWIKLDVFFMGVTRFNSPVMRVLWYSGIVPIIFFLFGVFIVIPGRGLANNLEAPERLLKRGKHVFIFPEGSVNKTGSLRPFKIGSATLLSMTGVPVVPILFKRLSEKGKREKVIVTLGDIISFTQSQNPDEINTVLQNKMAVMFNE